VTDLVTDSVTGFGTDRAADWLALRVMKIFENFIFKFF
jgi:hypothetical protein